MRDQKEPVCASSFAKNGHEPLYLDLQFRGGGSSCKFGGDDEKKTSNFTALFAGYFYTFVGVQFKFWWGRKRPPLSSSVPPPLHMGITG